MKHLFFVMEHVEFDIKSLFKLGSGGFSVDHVTIIMYNLLCAMMFVHSAGIIHRDIKPANILIDSNCVVKICDFGLSTLDLCKIKKTRTEGGFEHKERDQKTLDKPSSKNDKEVQKFQRKLSPAVQTRWYRSPEVIMLDKNYDT